MLRKTAIVLAALMLCTGTAFAKHRHHGMTSSHGHMLISHNVSLWRGGVMRGASGGDQAPITGGGY